MAYVAVDKDGTEAIFQIKPKRMEDYWYNPETNLYVNLPKGTIKKLIDRELTWKDKPVKI